jgi:hypothetical protein
MPRMRVHLCHETIIVNQWPIRLIQKGIDRFSVIYGKSVKNNLSYSQAALEYGSCIMHALTCLGKLDNRDKEGT